MNRISIETDGQFTTIYYGNQYYSTTRKSVSGIFAALIWGIIKEKIKRFFQ